MKKAIMCIGVFIILFLVVGVYTVQAEVTGGLNGTWLKFTGKLQGMEFADGPESTEAGKDDNYSIKLYGCLVDGPFYSNQFFVQLYEKEKTATRAGLAVFEKSAGTSEKFAGWFSMELMQGYDPDSGIYSTSVSAPGEMKIKNDKINFKGFGGQAEREPAGSYTNYALYGLKNFKAKTTTAKNLPFNEDTPCPARNIIQVVKTDMGVRTGTVTPAGPWVSVPSNVSQEFAITPAVLPCTFFRVYIDGNTETPYYTYESCEPITYTYTFTPGFNHSIWVKFY